ncbi:general secretion pathway protein GspM [Duganella sp. Leaf126]|uniref:type II secretion system protein GspM n=1 Tax=Duganella sp. Leaf126 TaxID=1736266 RepID=UPI0006FF804D|nr:type II secretion system protein GspM [Duganella sp. Leaf126]KQQ32630.1 general secretion pathway protein GspM [Duganella sp. Leaf126]
MSKFQQKIQDLQGRATTFWLARTEQERKLLAVGGVVVVLGLFYGVLLDPALSGRARLATELPLARQQAAEMQQLAREAAALRGQNAVAPPPMTRDSLAASLAAQGLGTPTVNITGEYARIQLTNVPFAAVVAWLEAARVDSRIAVQDANFVAQDVAGMVNGNITLRQSQQ